MRSFPRAFFLPALLAVAATACGIGHSQAISSSEIGAGGGGDAGSCAPRTTCGGACVDTSNDPKHCGACGSVCSSGACVAGACTTTPAGLPSPPSGPAPDGTGPVSFAIQHFYIGDTDRSFVSNSAAWKAYGLDIDGKTSISTSTDVCTLTPGAPRAVQTDGNDGIDNSFGENVLPMVLATTGSGISQRANQQLLLGDAASVIFEIGALGSGATYAPLSGAFFDTLPLGTPPVWNGSDVFPINSLSFEPDASGAAKYTFVSGYMRDHVFVSGVLPSVDLALPLIFSGTQLVTINHAQIVMQISDDGRTATNGVISGVLPTETFIAAMKAYAGTISSSLCTGSAFDSIAQQVRQAQDILDDGTQDPSRPCNAISIGLGFDAAIAQMGGAQSPPTTVDPCGGTH
jgi:hypothetical protein